MTRRLFVDTAVLALAVGSEHPLRATCRSLVEAAANGSVELHASAELVQEFCFHRLRRSSRADAVAQARDVAALCVLHPVDADVVDGMLGLVETTRLGGRDAVHAATALLHGFDAIVSPDQDFDGVPGLRRLDPSVWSAT